MKAIFCKCYKKLMHGCTLFQFVEVFIKQLVVNFGKHVKSLGKIAPKGKQRLLKATCFPQNVSSSFNFNWKHSTYFILRITNTRINRFSDFLVLISVISSCYSCCWSTRRISKCTSISLPKYI